MTQFVEASIGFLAACCGRPSFSASGESDNLPIVERLVRIENFRLATDTPCLEREGFELVVSPTGVGDFLDPEGRERYLRELEALILGLTGADKAVALANGVVRRSEHAETYRKDGTTVPGRFAHCDFSAGRDGSRRWIERILPAEEARWRSHRRFVIYNVWRSLTEPPQDTPLALCDARTVEASHRVVTDQHIDMADGSILRIENEVFRHGDAQRWGYFPHMSGDEVLVFKGFDSSAAGIGGVPHAAFDDPDFDGQSPPRESIDERIVAFFDES